MCGWCLDSTGVELWILSGCCVSFSEANILNSLNDNLIKVVSLQILLPGPVTTMEESDFLHVMTHFSPVSVFDILGNPYLEILNVTPCLENLQTDCIIP